MFSVHLPGKASLKDFCEIPFLELDEKSPAVHQSASSVFLKRPPNQTFKGEHFIDAAFWEVFRKDF